MAQARSKKVLVEHFCVGTGSDSHNNSRKLDFVATEEPLEIRLNDTTISTTMRTPGHDFELAAGFCLTEGLLDGGVVSSIRYCATSPASETEFNVVTVETVGDIPTPKPRLGTVTSACGVCGAESIAKLCENLLPLAGTQRIPLEVLAQIPEMVRPHQALFSKTGGVHAAAACSIEGEPLVVREDIGRHNAVDKVIGRLLLDDELPARNSAIKPQQPTRLRAAEHSATELQPTRLRAAEQQLCLFVSGRASFEMLQKAWAGGFSAVVSVSSPSSLAVELAQRANIQLAGFVRGGSLNLYNL